MAWLLANRWALWLCIGMATFAVAATVFALWLSSHDAALIARRDAEWQAEMTAQRSAEQARQAKLVADNYARGLADGIVRQSEREADREAAPIIVREIVEKSAVAAACRHDGVSAAGLGRLRVVDKDGR